MTPPTFHNLIGGQWLPAASGKTILNLNPADHTDVVGAFPASHAEDVDLAVAAARRAFAKWRLVPAPKRAEILVRAGNILVQNPRRCPGGN
jgi:aldehyde dehydrogenase (NAD+)